MSITLIITMGGIAVIVAALIVLNYRIKNDISVCQNCPYSNSLNCWDCRRKYSIKENKYNK